MSGEAEPTDGAGSTQTVAPPQRLVMERMIRLGEDQEDFDLDFWLAQSVEARWQAGWEMVRDWVRWQGKDPDALRLDRTVGRFRRVRR